MNNAHPHIAKITAALGNPRFARGMWMSAVTIEQTTGLSKRQINAALKSGLENGTFIMEKNNAWPTFAMAGTRPSETIQDELMRELRADAPRQRAAEARYERMVGR